MNGDPASRDGAALAELGGYFALPAVAADEGDELSTLLSDEEAVRSFVARTRSAIAASANVDANRIPMRVAASSFQLNVAARLISPTIGAAAVYGAVPLLGPTSVRWTASEHHTPRLGAATLDWRPAPTPVRAAEVISNTLLTNVIGPLAMTLREATSLSERISWGNTISAANGAVTVMATARPDLAPTGRAVVLALLDTGPLVDCGRVDGGHFVRRSCCLFYQAPGSGLCGDCVLDATQLQRPGR